MVLVAAGFPLFLAGCSGEDKPADVTPVLVEAAPAQSEAVSPALAGEVLLYGKLQRVPPQNGAG